MATIARQALLHPADSEPRNYRGSFLVDLGRVLTNPYIRPMPSYTRRRELFTRFDELASDWQLSIEDRSVIVILDRNDKSLGRATSGALYQTLGEQMNDDNQRNAPDVSETWVNI